VLSTTVPICSLARSSFSEIFSCLAEKKNSQMSYYNTFYNKYVYLTPYELISSVHWIFVIFLYG